MKITLKGSSLVGASGTRDRIEDDYYATPYESTEALLNVVEFKGDFLEPCVGGGHIADVLSKKFDTSIDKMDIVDRGVPNTIVADFLSYEFNKKYDNIITNPPYSLAQEFLEKSMSIVNEKGKVAMFLKIQFLESAKRKELFIKYPPKYIYVFSKRQAPWRDGCPVDEKGKPWSSTMCFAWFVWEEGYSGDSVVKWI